MTSTGPGAIDLDGGPVVVEGEVAAHRFGFAPDLAVVLPGHVLEPRVDGLPRNRDVALGVRFVVGGHVNGIGPEGVVREQTGLVHEEHVIAVDHRSPAHEGGRRGRADLETAVPGRVMAPSRSSIASSEVPARPIAALPSG